MSNGITGFWIHQDIKDIFDDFGAAEARIAHKRRMGDHNIWYTSSPTKDGCCHLATVVFVHWTNHSQVQLTLRDMGLGKEIDRVFCEGFHCAWICVEESTGPSEYDVLPWNRSGVLLDIVLCILHTVSVFNNWIWNIRSIACLRKGRNGVVFPIGVGLAVEGKLPLTVQIGWD